MTGTVENLGKGAIELVQIRMKLTPQDRRRFLKNPTLYFRAFFRANKLATNAFIADAVAMKKMVTKVRGMSGPVGTLMTIHAHVLLPKKYKSRRIIVITK